MLTRLRENHVVLSLLVGLGTLALVQAAFIAGMWLPTRKEQAVTDSVPIPKPPTPLPQKQSVAPKGESEWERNHKKRAIDFMADARAKEMDKLLRDQHLAHEQGRTGLDPANYTPSLYTSQYERFYREYQEEYKLKFADTPASEVERIAREVYDYPFWF